MSSDGNRKQEGKRKEKYLQNLKMSGYNKPHIIRWLVFLTQSYGLWRERTVRHEGVWFSGDTGPLIFYLGTIRRRMDGQLNDPITKEPPIPIENEAEWAPEPAPLLAIEPRFLDCPNTSKYAASTTETMPTRVMIITIIIS
jgi:hypothetical protein